MPSNANSKTVSFSQKVAILCLTQPNNQPYIFVTVMLELIYLDEKPLVISANFVLTFIKNFCIAFDSKEFGFDIFCIVK